MSKALSIDDAAAMLAEVQRNVRAPLSLEEASQRAAINLTDEFKELVAVLPNDWGNRVFSWLRIHGPSGADAIRDGNIFLLEGWMQSGLLACIDAGAITPVVRTSESERDLETLRKCVAYHNLIPRDKTAEAPPTVAAQPIEPTEADLDDAIIHDWRTLPTSEIRSRCRIPDYKTRFDALMQSGRLGR